MSQDEFSSGPKVKRDRYPSNPITEAQPMPDVSGNKVPSGGRSFKHTQPLLSCQTVTVVGYTAFAFHYI